MIQECYPITYGAHRPPHSARSSYIACSHVPYPLAIRAGGVERAGARKICKFPNLPRLVQGCFGVSSGCTRTRKRSLRHPGTSPAPSSTVRLHYSRVRPRGAWTPATNLENTKISIFPRLFLELRWVIGATRDTCTASETHSRQLYV